MAVNQGMQIICFGIILVFIYAVAAVPDNKTLVKPAGSLSLTHSNLANNVQLWEIQPAPQKNYSGPFKIDIFFTDLFLHQDDSLTIYTDLNASDDLSKSLFPPIHAQNGSVIVMTNLSSLVVKLEGNNTAFVRKFEAAYVSESCTFNVPIHHKSDTLRSPFMIKSPVYYGNETKVQCILKYNPDPHFRSLPLFSFEVFNFSSLSTVELKGTTYPFGDYKKDPAMEFFPVKGAKTEIDINLNVNKLSEESFILKVQMVDSECSKFISVGEFPETIASPDYLLDNGTFGTECVWVVKRENTVALLGVSFTQLAFTSVLDIVAINDGASRSSPALYQVTTSNVNSSIDQFLRTSGPYLWISFRPESFSSKMKANITVHNQGGHFKNNGTITMKVGGGNDTIYMLEVEKDRSVLLNFTTSLFPSPSTLSIYDGFDMNNPIATLHNSVSYPILSSSSKMMIVATDFIRGQFTADFYGVLPGCTHMSTLTDQNYVLSGNCNSKCSWIIPPQNVPGSALLLDVQYLSLDKEDTVQIYQLDAAKTLIGKVDSTMGHIPQLTFPVNAGALVDVTRNNCSKPSDVAFVGHSSFIPSCGGKLNLTATEEFHITSPLYPDTYPLFANCIWTLLSPQGSLNHLAFDKLSLAPSHCIRIYDAAKNATSELDVLHLPGDLFLSNGSSVQFSSNNCKSPKSALELVSSEGFRINGSVAECGSVLDKASGQFEVNVTSLKQSLCMWKVSVPPTSDDTKDSVNIIAYTITAKENKGNYVLKIFDGASVRDSEIDSGNTSEVWSRTNNLIFYYKRPNISAPSSVFVVNYKTISCNSSMLCDNGICMHPDWRCNGKNECGDFSDEIKCGSVPIPDDNKPFGYTAGAFWAAFICMFLVGALLGFVVPFGYQKYKNGYHRFSDISVIE